MLEEAMMNDEVDEPMESANPDESKARSGGWLPLEEWKGDPEDWVSAKAFNKQGELFSYIKKTNKEMAELKTAVTTLSEINRNIAEVERNKAIAEIQELRREAFRNQDIDAADELSEKLSELKSMPVKEEIEENLPQQPNEVFANWVETNAWYVENKVLQGAANAIAQELIETDDRARDNQSYLLREVEKRIKQEFPTKFVDRQSKIGENSNTRSRSDGLSSKLDETTMKVLKGFVDDGTYKDIDAAIKSYKKYNQIK